MAKWDWNKGETNVSSTPTLSLPPELIIPKETQRPGLTRDEIKIVPVSCIVKYRPVWNGRKLKWREIHTQLIKGTQLLFFPEKKVGYTSRSNYNKVIKAGRLNALLDRVIAEDEIKRSGLQEVK